MKAPMPVPPASSTPSPFPPKKKKKKKSAAAMGSTPNSMLASGLTAKKPMGTGY